jgi:hypothetical protein
VTVGVPRQDQFATTGGFNQDRAAPAAFSFARSRPQRLTGQLVDSQQETFLIRVAVLNQHVVNKDRAGSGAPRAGEFSEIAVPELLAVHCQAEQSAALAEEAPDPFAVRYAGGRRPAVHDVRIFRLAFPEAGLPDDLSGVSIHAQSHPFGTTIKRGRQEQSLAPDDG